MWVIAIKLKMIIENRPYNGLDVDMGTNMQNIANLVKLMSTYNKQHLSSIWDSNHQKVRQHWGWAVKKHCL